MNSSYYVIPMIAGSFAALAGSITAAVLQFRGSRRTASGSVDSSDARLVFEQMQALVNRLTEENKDLRAQIAQLRAELDELREHLEKGFCSKEECDLRLRAYGKGTP